MQITNKGILICLFTLLVTPVINYFLLEHLFSYAFFIILNTIVFTRVLKINPLIAGVIAAGAFSFLSYIYSSILDPFMPAGSMFLSDDSGKEWSLNRIFYSLVFIFIASVFGLMVGFAVMVVHKMRHKENSPINMPINKPEVDLTSSGGWSPWILGIASVISLGSAYLVAWKSFKSIGETKIAEKILIFGGIAFIVVAIVLTNLPFDNNIQSLSVSVEALKIIGFGLTGWYIIHHKKWKDRGGKPAKFQWSMIGLIIGGLVLSYGATLFIVFVKNLFL